MLEGFQPNSKFQQTVLIVLPPQQSKLNQKENANDYHREIQKIVTFLFKCYWAINCVENIENIFCFI